MANIERIIKEVNGTMSIEGMKITSEDKNRIRYCLNNKNSLESMINHLVNKYTTQAVSKND